MKENSKQIIVKTCSECPFCEYDDGGGHCGDFYSCKKFSILLWDSDSFSKNFDIKKGIHPKCGLKWHLDI